MGCSALLQMNRLQAATAAALLHIYHPEAAATLRLNLQAELLHCCRACLRAVGS